jgi:hypothetical protein
MLTKPIGEDKIRNMVKRSVGFFTLNDVETENIITDTIVNVLSSKRKKIDNIQAEMLAKPEDIPNGYACTEDAVNLVKLIHSVLSEYLADNIDWWVEIALEQYRRIAEIEIRRITNEVLSAYAKGNKAVTKEDVKNATYKSMFQNTPSTKVNVLIPKSDELTNDIIAMVNEFRGRHGKPIIFNESSPISDTVASAVDKI